MAMTTEIYIYVTGPCHCEHFLSFTWSLLAVLIVTREVTALLWQWLLRYYYYWSLLYSAILCSRADSSRSCRMWFWMRHSYGTFLCGILMFLFAFSKFVFVLVFRLFLFFAFPPFFFVRACVRACVCYSAKWCTDTCLISPLDLVTACSSAPYTPAHEQPARLPVPDSTARAGHSGQGAHLGLRHHSAGGGHL